MKSPRTEPVMVRVAPKMLARLDKWRGQQANPPTRPEAIRRLVEIGLQHDEGDEAIAPTYDAGPRPRKEKP